MPLLRKICTEWKCNKGLRQKETLERIKKDVSKMPAKDVREKLVDILFQQVLDDRYRNDDWW